jgi:CBS domain-containing protein
LFFPGRISQSLAISEFFDVTKCVEDHWSVRQRYYENRKNSTVKKFVEKPDRKSTKGPPKRVKEVACEEPKPLQAKSLVKEAGEKIRSFHTDRLPVASGDRLVGAVEGKYPERKAAGFGHDPETTLVREIMVKKKVYYCFENQSLDEAREIMREHHLQYLPVVDENLRVIGTVGLRDLAAERQRRNK